MASLKAVILAIGSLASLPADHSPPPRELGADQLVVATSRELAPVLRKAATILEQRRPDLKISVLSVGSDVAMADLYTRKADVAIIGRAASDPEIKAFQWVFQYPPQALPVWSGSLATPGHSPTVRVLVNASNPVSFISTRQLEIVYRGERPVYWSDLGVTGRLAREQVHPVMPDTEQGTGRFIRHAVFSDATLFAWKRVREISEPIHRDGSTDAMGHELAAAVAADRQALALVPGAPIAGTRSVRVTCDTRGKAQVCDSKGALERTIYAYCDPKAPPDVRSFLKLLEEGADRELFDIAPYRRLPAGQQ